MQALKARAYRPPNRDELITSNMGLVHAHARRIQKTQPQIDYEDLVSAGTIGLIKAVDRHDSTKAKLSTFSCTYINGEIMREIRDKWQPVKIPRSHYELSSKLFKLLNKGMDDEAIAFELEITVDELWAAKESINALDVCSTVDELLGVDVLLVENNALVGIFKNLSPKVQETYGLIRNAKSKVTTAFLATKLKVSQGRARNYVYQLKSIDLLLRDESGTITLNPNPSDYEPYSQIDRLTNIPRTIFNTICCLGRTTTEAIALETNIGQKRVAKYCKQLVNLQLVVRDGFWLSANFEPVVVKGIKNKIMQQIEVTNFLAKLEEWMKMKAAVQKLEDELKKQGGDRVESILANLTRGNALK